MKLMDISLLTLQMKAQKEGRQARIGQQISIATVSLQKVEKKSFNVEIIEENFP